MDTNQIEKKFERMWKKLDSQFESQFKRVDDIFNRDFEDRRAARFVDDGRKINVRTLRMTRLHNGLWEGNFSRIGWLNRWLNRQIFSPYKKDRSNIKRISALMDIVDEYARTEQSFPHVVTLRFCEDSYFLHRTKRDLTCDRNNNFFILYESTADGVESRILYRVFGLNKRKEVLRLIILGRVARWFLDFRNHDKVYFHIERE